MSQRPSVAVITDSACDLSPEIASAHDITVVPLIIQIDGKEYRDQVDLDTNQFMHRMVESESLPTILPPTVQAFELAFTDAASTHDEILCIVSSSKLSGTLGSATTAAEHLAESVHIEIVDSLNTTYGLGFQALRAANLAASGVNAVDIAAALNAELNRYHVVFFVEALEHLRRGGHIGKAASMVGSLLQLRPLLRIDEGQIVPYERTRTRSKAMDTLAEFAGSTGIPEEIAVIYNSTPEDARIVAGNAGALTPDRDVIVAQLGPVITTHIGPDVLGLVIKERLGD